MSQPEQYILSRETAESFLQAFGNIDPIANHSAIDAILKELETQRPLQFQHLHCGDKFRVITDSDGLCQRAVRMRTEQGYMVTIDKPPVSKACLGELFRFPNPSMYVERVID